MIQTDKQFVNLQCDRCEHAQGPKAESVEQAIDQAINEGWTRSTRPGTSIVWYICPDCTVTTSRRWSVG